MKKLSEKQKSIIDIFIQEAKKIKAIPTKTDLKKRGIERDKIRYYFGTHLNLIKIATSVDKSIKNLPKKSENDSLAKKREIIDLYTDLVKSVRPFPMIVDLTEKGIGKDTIKNHFKSVSDLRKSSMDLYPEVYSGSLREADLLDGHKELLSAVKNKKEFIITTAVSGQKSHSKAINTLTFWQKQSKDRMVIVLPSLDTAHNLDNEIEWFFDEDVLRFPMAFGEVKLNDNFHISDFPVTAKQINPITGIGAVVQGKGSMVFASPKQSLEFESVSSGEKYPHAGMSTGAITIPNYKSSRGNSQRSAWIAEKHHKMGAIIVEIEDNKTYHFRQITFDTDGGFHDLGLYYVNDQIGLSESKATKKEDRPIMVRGDYHVGHHDEVAVMGSEEIAKITGIKTVFDHDFVDGSFCNPHESDNLIASVRNQSTYARSAKDELALVGQEIVRASKTFDTQYLIDSNHHDFLSRWLQKGAFFKEPHNYEVGVVLANELIKGRDPLIEGLRLFGNIPNFDKLLKDKKIIFLSKKEDKKYKDLHVGTHGHLGRNGKRNPNKAGLEKGYGKGIFGHSHTSGILRDIIQVGCLEKLRPGYNNGPSGWIHNVALAYPDSSVQLINIIFGKYARKQTIDRVKSIRKKLSKA